MADGLLGSRPGDTPRSTHDHVFPGDCSPHVYSPRSFSPRAVSPRTMSPRGRNPRDMSPFSVANVGILQEPRQKPRKLILCFDGTGNKFHGDDSDSNILKIFRMLDRSADDQYHYYQPGIGTYVISDSLTHTGPRARIKSWYQKAKDSAIGSSFDQHVVGGYRFLMRFYQQGDEIYMFGFSRGAYIARFLAEMIDYIGLLCHGNEEMVKFAWKAFAQWQSRKPAMNEYNLRPEDAEENKHARKMYEYMKGFRETFSRPVDPIRFLGLFDTVNSVPRFETAWMQRSKFPYTARSSARIIRHAVSIDERRAKFRQDLMYQKAPKHEHHAHKDHRHIGPMIDKVRKALDHPQRPPRHQPDAPEEEEGEETNLRGADEFLSPWDMGRGRRGAIMEHHRFAPYRARDKSRPWMVSGAIVETDAMSCSDASQWQAELNDRSDEEQDIDEVWFAGGHGDVGGGWRAPDGDKCASHVPLAWMVREAMKAGLAFDLDNVRDMGCQDPRDSQIRPSARAARPAIQVQDEEGHVQEGQQTSSRPSPEMKGVEYKVKDFAPDPTSAQTAPPFDQIMHKAHTSLIHDSLEYGKGAGFMTVTAWRLMEYLPFRRMDLQPDGSWKPIRWPLPCGETRDMPDHVRVHGSVIRRLREDKTYRPGNLIIGGGGRGVRTAGPEHGIGEWICVAESGDVIGEIWSRKPRGDCNGQ